MLTTVTETIEVEEMITHTHRTSMVVVVDMKTIIGATEIQMCTTTKKNHHTLLHGKAPTADLIVVEDQEALIGVHVTMIHIIVGILMTGVDNPPPTAIHMCEMRVDIHPKGLLSLTHKELIRMYKRY